MQVPIVDEQATTGPPFEAEQDDEHFSTEAAQNVLRESVEAANGILNALEKLIALGVFSAADIEAVRRDWQAFQEFRAGQHAKGTTS